MQHHPRSADIANAMAACLPHVGAWDGTFFRMTTVSYANRLDLLTGKGSQVHGARWTPKGRFRSVYGSLDPHTAMAENLGNYEDYGIPISQAMPLVVVGVVARLQSVLDISAAKFLDPLGVSIADLAQLDWKAEQAADREALTQAIGRQAYAARVEAILAPSARTPVGRNIIVFPQNRLKGSSLRIENVRDLPKRKE
jgi:RES domain-containing protein